VRSGEGRYQQREESRRDRCGDRQQVTDGLDTKDVNHAMPVLAAAIWLLLSSTG
jgi:hypothetical protein